jgi:hypothetical protein
MSFMGEYTITIPPLAIGKGIPRKARKKQPEGMVVNACIKYLFALGCFVWRNSTGAWRDGAGRIIRYGKVGSPDVLGVTAGGRLIGVETKTGNNPLTPEQEDFRARILEKGGLYIVARNSIDALEQRKAEILAKPVWQAV